MKSKIVRIAVLVAVLVLSLFITFLSVASAFVSFFGIYNYTGDIRTVYVKGLREVSAFDGIEATFVSNVSATITKEDLNNAITVIETRLVNNNITDYKVYSDNGNIVVRFPYDSVNSKFDAMSVIYDLSETAMLTFCGGTDNTNVIINGSKDIKNAYASIDPDTNLPIVVLVFTEEGSKKFALATQEYLGSTISIWMDDVMISMPTVVSVITNGEAIINGIDTAEAAADFANKINAGALPFTLSVDESSIKQVMIRPPFESYAPTAIIFIASVAIAAICFVVATICTILIIAILIPRKKLTQIES